MGKSDSDRETSGGSTTIGIVGTSPSGVIGPLRVVGFDQFLRKVGEIEGVPARDYYAAHAACHVLMNGVDRVAFRGVEDSSDEDQLKQAVSDLLETQPVDLLVVPGVTGVDVSRALVETFSKWSQRRKKFQRTTLSEEEATSLWLDPPRDASVDDIVAHRQVLGGDSSRVRLVTPWISTITPGRRPAERLPASCLVGPLYLGTTAFLKGVHEISNPPEPSLTRKLKEASCGLLVPEGWRRRVRLAFPPPRVDPTAAQKQPERGLEERITDRLRQVCEPALTEFPSGPSLWKTLERRCMAVMMAFQTRGEITKFGVRCDEETNMDVIDGVALEVWFKVPRRVREVIIRVAMR